MLSEEQKELAISLALEGRPLREIYKRLGLNHRDFHREKEDTPVFRAAFEHARSEGLETLADDLISIAEEMEDVQKAKLKSDNIKFLLSKRKASTYGDRIDLNVNQTVDIGSALAEARSRLVSPRDPELKPSLQLIDITRLITKSTPDYKSEDEPDSNIEANGHSSEDVAPELDSTDIFD